MSRYLEGAVIPPTAYEKLFQAIKETVPNQNILFVSDRTDEIAHVNEALDARIHVVSCMPAEAYIDPYTVPATQATSWYGYYVPSTGEIFSAGNKEKESAFADEAKLFVVGFYDIRNFIYSIDTGMAMPVYDLFACQRVGISAENLLGLKRFAAMKFSPNAACQRYSGAIDSIAVAIRNHAKWKESFIAALEENPSADPKDFPPITGADPRNSAEVFELLTLFIFTWLRASMITDYIDGKRKAVTKEQQQAVTNELILRWWRKEAEDRFTLEEMFEKAAKNIFVRGFLAETGITDFTGVKENYVDYTPAQLYGFYDSIVQMKDSLRGKLLSTPYGTGYGRDEARAVCASIINSSY